MHGRRGGGSPLLRRLLKCLQHPLVYFVLVGLVWHLSNQAHELNARASDVERVAERYAAAATAEEARAAKGRALCAELVLSVEQALQKHGQVVMGSETRRARLKDQIRALHSRSDHPNASTTRGDEAKKYENMVARVAPLTYATSLRKSDAASVDNVPCYLHEASAGVQHPCFVIAPNHTLNNTLVAGSDRHRVFEFESRLTWAQVMNLVVRHALVTSRDGLFVAADTRDQWKAADGLLRRMLSRDAPWLPAYCVALAPRGGIIVDGAKIHDAIGDFDPMLHDANDAIEEAAARCLVRGASSLHFDAVSSTEDEVYATRFTPRATSYVADKWAHALELAAPDTWPRVQLLFTPQAGMSAAAVDALLSAVRAVLGWDVASSELETVFARSTDLAIQGVVVACFGRCANPSLLSVAPVDVARRVAKAPLHLAAVVTFSA